MADASDGGWFRSTVYVRTVAAALVGTSLGAMAIGAAACFAGPDSSSGMNSTAINTRIEAPVRRSLSRRSIIK